MASRLVRCARLLALLIAGAAAGETVSMEIPLQGGRLHVRQVLEAILRKAGIDPGARLDGLEWTIDARSAIGRYQAGLFDRLVPGAIMTELRPDAFIVYFDREALRAGAGAALDAFMHRLRATVEAHPADAPFGLTCVTRDSARAPLRSLPPGSSRAVVLVHGLDDPGWTWRDMSAGLLDAGYTVLRFEYPNDQAIADSATLLATELEALRARGVTRIDVVAHSMGGLVARDVLTRKALYGGDGAGHERYPAIHRLIMLGTPNHGSSMAKLRGLGETGEQISRWLSGDGASSGQALRDGAGEAGRDLLPDSEYLKELNGRPAPAYTQYTIVAGRMSPVTGADIERFTARLDEAAGGAARHDAEAAARWLKTVVSGLGDGLVSIESARLEGASDTVVVEANHVSMIVNVPPSDAPPPALPIVLDRLAKE